MIISKCEQQSEQWFDEKLGIPSASKFNLIITSKGEPSTSAEKYMHELAYEKITGKRLDGFSGKYLDRGNNIEPDARSYYSLVKDCDVEEVGLCFFDERKDRSCSPDGLVTGEKRGLEIKCRTPFEHAKALNGKKLPTSAIQQVQGSLYVTGYSSWDYLEYFPGMPKQLIVTVEPDYKFILKLGRLLDEFNGELDSLVERLTK